MARSDFYHAFSPSWNWWYVGVLGLFVIMFFVGLFTVRWRKSKVTPRGLVPAGPRDKFIPAFYWFLSGIAATVTAVWILLASHRGIMQFALNALTRREDPAWAYLITMGAFIVLWVLSIGLYHWASSLGRRIAANLHYRQARIVREQRASKHQQ